MFIAMLRVEIVCRGHLVEAVDVGFLAKDEIAARRGHLNVSARLAAVVAKMVAIAPKDAAKARRMRKILRPPMTAAPLRYSNRLTGSLGSNALLVKPR